MIVAMLLAGATIGAVAAMAALVMGQTIWIALLIYSGTGILGVLAAAAKVALRADPAVQSDTDPQPSARPERA